MVGSSVYRNNRQGRRVHIVQSIRLLPLVDIDSRDGRWNPTTQYSPILGKDGNTTERFRMLDAIEGSSLSALQAGWSVGRALPGILPNRIDCRANYS